MTAPRLNSYQRGLVDAEIDDIFDLLLTRLLGGAFTGKKLFISYLHDWTLPGLFEHALNEEGGRIDIDVVSGLAAVAKDLLDKTRSQTKASTKRKVQGLLNDIDAGRMKVEDFGTAMDGELAEVFGKVKASVRTIVNSESMHAVSMGAKEGIDQINSGLGVEDPTICWIHPLDKYTCSECYRMFYLSDMVTPRVWKESEVTSEYHKKGDPNPSYFLAHPNCRGALSTVLPGFGFSASGHVTYIAANHDEWSYQRGLKNDPPEGVDARRDSLGKSEHELPTLTKSDYNEWWHGSPSGDMRGGATGLHIGTWGAANDALTARVGHPVEGVWDGTRELGSTLLAGKKTLKERGIYPTGYNVDAPEEDYYPTKMSSFSGGEPVLATHRPDLFRVQIVGPMSNTLTTPHADFAANGRMRSALQRGIAKRGYFYTNIGEGKAGNISAVLPGPNHVVRVMNKSAPEIGEPLDKALRIGMRRPEFAAAMGRFGWSFEEPNKHLGMKHSVSGQRWKGLSHSDPDSLDHQKVKYYAGQVGLTVGQKRGVPALVARKGHPYEEHYRKVQGLTEDDFA